MEDLNGGIENMNRDFEDSIIDPIQRNSLIEKNEKIEKDTKMEKDNTQIKSEDLDGLQMLRLAQEDNNALLKKIIVPGSNELIDQKIILEDSTNISLREGDESNHDIKCFQIAKSVVKVPSYISQDNSALEDPKLSYEDNIDIKSNFQTKKSEKHKGVEGIGTERKPALVKKEVSNLHGLTERQQKILQDFHVKFVLEGVNVEVNDEARASKHLEFVGLKKRLEEEEKMYAGCALSEASNIDQIDVDPSTVTLKNLTPTHNLTEDINSLEPAHAVVRATMDEVINNFEEIAICGQDSSLLEDMKPLLQPQNMKYAMKGLVDDDGLSELQEYTDREGSTRCQVCLFLK
jgi:hypothetical protein